MLFAAIIVIPRAILIQHAHSETSDDDYHLVRGLEFLHRDPGLVHRELNDPPLGEALGALPLWVMGGTTHGRIEGTAIYGQACSPETAMRAVAIWKGVLFLPLIAVVFIWCRNLYGLASAWLATVLLVIEPTIAGHLHLAALDVIGTTAIVLGCLLGWRFVERPSGGRLIAAASGCAAAMLIKHTGILLPVILVGYAVMRRVGHAIACRRAAEGAVAQNRHALACPMGTAMSRVHVAAFVLTTFLAIWILLAFDVSPIRIRSKQVSFPAGLYIQSLRDAANHVANPNDAYLFGQIRRGGWWYYFAVAATYKIPLGVACIIVLGLLSFFNRKLEFREWSLLIPLLGYTVFLMLQNIDIGWRHFLPPYVFLLMLGGRCLAAGVSGRIAPWMIVGLTAFNTTFRWHPDYLSYITWPRKDAHLAISDSNLDWGQGLKEVRDWIDKNQDFIAGRTVYFRGFAVKDRAVKYYLGDRAENLLFSNAPPHSGILIISPVCLSGISESNDEYAFLRTVRPRAIIGHTLRVFDLDHLQR